MPKGLPKRVKRKCPARLGETVSLKLSSEQKRALEEAAAAEGMRFGTWARMTLLAQTHWARVNSLPNGTRLAAPELPKR